MTSTASLRFLFAATTLLCVCACGASARAQQSGDPKQSDFPGLDIQAEPWWDGHVDLSAPVPFSFLISNFSQDTIEGQLTLTDLESGQILNLGEVFIGPNSIRRFSTIQAVPDWGQCLAIFRHEGRVLWARVLILTTGKDFSEDVNYLLFVDDGSRRLQLPIHEESNSGNASGGAGRFIPEIGQGRAVQPVSVKTWQIPQHPGPLTVAQAIVFSEATKLEMLNEAQWDAIGKWICLGGTVFVSENSAGIFDRLKKASPLSAQPGIVIEELTVYRCGTGSIREFAGPLFSATDVETPRKIAVSASRLSRNNTMSMLTSRSYTARENRNSEITRMWVVIFFLIYTLLSSSVLFFYRMTRRNVMIFTSVVVGSSCTAAVILGGFLRSSRGDLCWVTVTSAGPGGLLQLGAIDVQSAGGRNTRLTVQGRHADLQLSETGAAVYDNYHGYNYFSQATQSHFPAFTWQPSQLTDEDDAYKIGVPINPWGRRRLHATAWQPLDRGVEIEMTYSQQPQESGAVTGMNGSINVTATSSLPFNLENCRLVIGMSQARAGQDGTPRNRGVHLPYQTNASSVVQIEQVDSIADFGTLSPSVPVSIAKAPGTWVSITARDDQYWRSRNGEFIPQIPYSGATGIWIVAGIAKSPILSIDEQRSDFEPMQEQHWYVQEILPEQIPPELLELTQRLLAEQIKAAAAQAAAELDEK